MRALLEELILRYLEVSDCEMQEGSLRCDANVNLHIMKDGQKIATPIVEVKNLNSFRAVEGTALRGRAAISGNGRKTDSRSMMRPRPPAAGTTLTWSQRHSARRSRWLTIATFAGYDLARSGGRRPRGLTALQQLVGT